MNRANAIQKVDPNYRVLPLLDPVRCKKGGGFWDYANLRRSSRHSDNARARCQWQWDAFEQVDAWLKGSVLK